MSDSNGMGYAIVGLELQGELDHSMPVRCLEYDTLEYSRQLSTLKKRNRKEKTLTSKDYLSGITKETKLMPVVTIVFYLGKDPYIGCTELHDMLEWNKDNMKYKPYVENYHINLVCMQDIEEENLHTGLQEVIGSMKRSKDKVAFTKYCERNEARFRSLDYLTFQTLCEIIGEKKLIPYGKYKGKKEETIDMCKALEDMREDARMEGKTEGKKEGKMEGKMEGKEQLNKLVLLLLHDNRVEDLARSASDIEYQNTLCVEYGI